jgi:hypothetical protein
LEEPVQRTHRPTDAVTDGSPLDDATLPPPAEAGTPFDGFFLAGFECSDHRVEDGRRVDVLAGTGHDRLAARDYALLRGVGIDACREGVSWVRCEPQPGCFDFGSLLPRLAAAREYGIQISWDLMHFGWPDDVDVLAPGFPARFGSYAKAFVRWLADHSDRRWLFTPINEMSFLAWAGGDMRILNPFCAARGVELKVQLVLATIEAIEEIRQVFPGARFLHPEPLINIVADPGLPKTWRRVESDNLLQYQAWDMLSGRVWPRLGGHPKYLDILGVNFYPDNQFMPDGTTVHRGDARYRPLSHLLAEVGQRYGRPLIISETGSEGDARVPWLRYVADECAVALAGGCDLHALTLYPILNHPGWVDDRHCHNGLWDYPDEAGERACHQPLAEEIARQSERLREVRAAMLARRAAAHAPLSRSHVATT